MNSPLPVQAAPTFAPSEGESLFENPVKASDGAFVWRCRWCRKTWQEAFGDEKMVKQRRFCSRHCLRQSEYAKNGDAIRTRANDDYKKNRELRKAQRKQYYYANIRKEKAKRKIYYHATKEISYSQKSYKFKAEYHELKRLIFQKHQNRCKECGEQRLACLSIDHVQGDGAEHRKTKSALNQLRDVLYDTSGRFAILCMNCQWVKRVEKKEFLGRTFYLPEKSPDLQMRAGA